MKKEFGSRASLPPKLPHRMASQPAAATMPSASTTPNCGVVTPHTAPSNPAANTDAMASLLSGSRDLIKAVQKLEALNIDTALPSLPKIVVVGDQSAGKSSVIEALCDITLPRSSGTCTRCPFLITTTAASPGEGWNCKVTIHRKFSYESKPSGSSNSSGAKPPYRDWSLEEELEIFDFDEVHDKRALEVVLRRAQLAVLNPDRDHRHFVKTDPDANRTTKVNFSPNVVSLEIMGANLSELSLFDLPGAINSTGKQSELHLVQFVEKLLKTYMTDKQAIILLVCAANQDFENSTAFRFLGESAGIDRCMGVLTKPDLWLKESDNTYDLKKLGSIEEALRGTHFPVAHGWYVTKQLSQTELESAQQISYEEARHKEANFFQNDPWNAALATHTKRFGIPNLQTALSKKLTEKIRDSFPDIIARVKDRLTQVEIELQGFPDQADSPYLSVIMEIDRLKTALIRELDADEAHDFRRNYRAVLDDFSKKIRAGKPIVLLQTPGYERKPISLDSDEEMDDESPIKARKTGASGRAASTTPRRPVASNVHTPITGDRVRSRRVPKSDEPDACTATVFRLDEVQSQYDAASGADIGGYADLKTTKKLMVATVQQWGSLVDQLLVNVRTAFEAMLNRVLDQAPGTKFPGTLLLHEAKRITYSLFEEVMIDARDKIDCIVACESHRSITYNKEAFAEKRREYENCFNKRRAVLRVREHLETMQDKGINVPKTVAEWDKRAADDGWVLATLGVDPYHRELTNLPWPAAYYDLATGQFVDVVGKILEYVLLFSFVNRIATRLHQDLRVNDNAHCAELLAEDPARERERAKLVGERHRLQQAAAELQTLSGVPMHAQATV